MGHLASMAHLGTRGFDSISGEVVQTTAFVIDTESRPGHQGRFFRLVSGRNEAEKAQMLGDAIESGDPAVVFGASMHDFALVPESPVVYWLSEAMKAAFAKGERLGDVAHPRQGSQQLTTTVSSASGSRCRPTVPASECPAVVRQRTLERSGFRTTRADPSESGGKSGFRHQLGGRWKGTLGLPAAVGNPQP